MSSYSSEQYKNAYMKLMYRFNFRLPQLCLAMASFPVTGDVIDMALDSPGAMEPELQHQDILGTQPVGNLWAPRLAAQSLLRSNAKHEFADSIFDIHKFWLQLVHTTTLLPNIPYTHLSVLAAFQAIDKVIQG